MVTILVVEDNLEIQEMLTELFELEGYTTIAASDGLRGLQLAQQHHPDLIITDTNMPLMHGYDMLALVKQDARLAGIPVIVIGGETDREFIEKGRRLGLSVYWQKPFSPAEFLSEVQAQLNRGQSGRL